MTDTTESDRIGLPQVSDKQSIAVDALVSGATHQQAADAAGVTRPTVTDWKNHNVTFIAEWNRRRRDRDEVSGSMLRECLTRSLSLILQRIDEGDLDTALRLLRITGVEHLLESSRVGPTSNNAVTAKLAAEVDFDLSSQMMIRPESIFFVEDLSEAVAEERD